MIRYRFQAALIGFLMGVAGCGGSSVGPTTEASPERAVLLEVAEVYRQYSADHLKPPLTLGDLTSLRTIAPAGINALGTGDVVLQYGAKMTDTNDGPTAVSSDQVLAYGKKVPEAGGEVLMLDRTVKSVTAEQFKTMPKAQK